MKPASLWINAGKEGGKQTGPKKENETDNDRETQRDRGLRDRDRGLKREGLKEE